MSRPRRSLKKISVIESSSNSEDEVPNKKLNVFLDKNNSSIKQNTKDDSNSSSSESDIENYLQPINKLDLSSSFFSLKANDDNIKNTSGVEVSRLSDSESSVDDTACSSKTNEIEQTTEAPQLNFQHLENFALKIEEAKIQVEKYNAKTKKNEKELNISSILTEGETKRLSLGNIKVEDLHPSDFETTDDEEWEEVKIKEPEEKNIIPKNDIEICVSEMPDKFRKKKGNCLLTALKRRLNKIRKENQIYVHKVHLLCWIAHGNFLNSVINESEILSSALALLPSDKCYPCDRIDLSYLEQIVQWYRRTIRLTEKTPSDTLTLLEALKLQIKKKEVYDKNGYVLIFIAILRALGIQCRLILSFQVEPLRPPSTELHSLSTKETNKKGNRKTTESRKQKQSKGVPTRVQETVNKKESMPSEIKNYKDCNTANKYECKATTNIQKTNEIHAIKNTEIKNTNKNIKTRLKTQNKKVNTNPKNCLPIKEHASLAKQISKSNDSSKVATSVKRKSIRCKSKEKELSLLDKKITNKNRNICKAVNKKVDTTDENNLILGNNKPSTKSNDGENSQGRNTRSKSLSSVPKRKIRSTVSKRSEKKIPQLDGGNDDSPKNVSKKQSISQKRKHNVIMGKKTKKHAQQVTSSFNSSDSENDFLSSPLKKIPEQRFPSTSRLEIRLDIRNDIKELIKGRISEQKNIDRMRMVQKRKHNINYDDSDSDYMPEPIKKKHHDSDDDIDYFVPKPKVKKRVSVRRLGPGQPIISDSDDTSTKKIKEGKNIWLELFLESEEKWISVDITRGQVHCVHELYVRATHPVSYIVAWNNDHTLKDVTRRYCKNFNTVTRKLRIDAKWWEDTLAPFLEKSTARSKEEDNDLNRQQLDQPLPKVISEYKNHPLYALRRHLLKFEEIYPPEQVPLGYVRGEPVYPRSCVYVCKSRDIWLKEAKVVKLGEKPYKVVKARPKYDKLSNTVISDQLLEIFGPWQTTDYDPPTAENGIVPRNAFGNVELFKSCMLPKKTVHLKLPGLNKICKKLNIDCASAIVGFDFHGGWSHPVYDGFVVCEEYADICVAAWDAEQQDIEKKENEKIEKRVYTNWKRLIKGLLIKKRLKAKYDFGEETSTGKKGNKKVGINKKRKVAAKKREPSSDSESD